MRVSVTVETGTVVALDTDRNILTLSGGNFQIADTSVNAPNFGGRVGFERSDKAGGTSRIKTVDGEELRNEWDYRLTKWFRNKDSMFT